MRVLGLVLLMGGLSVVWAAPQPTKKNAPPNVFLVTIDTLRADHVHCYGDAQIKTPTLDALARDGILFQEAFTPIAITTPSHATILTGLWPSDHGVSDFGVPLSPEHPDLAELLKPQGYRTAAFIGSVILDSHEIAPGFDRGFDYYDNFPQNLDPTVHWGRIERRGMEVEQRAEDWLKAQPGDGPFFVWVHLYDPHEPYEPPEPYLTEYKGRPYDGEIAYADAALGKWIGYLKERGLYEGSLIVVMSDHGEGLGEHHEDTHGIFLYDTTTHVPLIVKLPKEEGKGREVGAQVRTTDVLPTILDVVGGKLPGKVDGETLREYFSGGGGKGEEWGRTAYGETDYPLHFGWAPLRSVRDHGVKLIEAPRPELYDLEEDPKELHNKYETGSQQAGRLNGLLTAWTQSMPQTAEEANASHMPDAKDHLDEKNLKQFESILSAENQGTAADGETYRRLMTADVNSAAADLQSGQIALAGKNYSVALDYLQRAVKADPKSAEAALYYGKALEETGNLAGAKAALETSLKLDGNQFEARVELGKVYLGMKEAGAAEDQFEAALLLQPGDGEAELNLGKSQLAQKKYKEAAESLQAAIKADVKNKEAYELLSQAYEGLGEKDKAQAAAAEAAALPRTQSQ